MPADMPHSPPNATTGESGVPETFMVRLDVRKRSTYLSARSEQVPGLHVIGDDADDVRRRAIPAVKHLLKANRQLDVDVYPTDDLAELRVRVRTA